MTTRLVAQSTGHVGITPPQPLATLTLAAERVVDGQAVQLGTPTNPSGDGLAWEFDPESGSVPASLIGVSLKLTWTETARDGGAIFTAIEYVTVEQGLIAGAPRYTTLGSLKAYGRAGLLPGQTVQTQPTEDDNNLLLAIARAEESVDCYCGTSFEFQPGRREICRQMFVDRYGWITARLEKPIAAVTSIELLDRASQGDFYPMAISTLGGEPAIVIDDSVPTSTAPTLASYRFTAQAVAALNASGRGQYWIRVTYDAGYASIPAVLEAVVNRTAWWFAKVRDVPMGTVRDLTANIVTIPSDFPRDIKGQMQGWRNLPL